MKTVITLLFTFLYVNLYGQALLKGRVVDRATNKNVPFATVYLNGTSQGGIANENGQFKLKVDAFPVELVVSHVGYERLVVSIPEIKDANLKVIIDPVLNDLGKVTIVEDNQRQRNIKEFKEHFLGIDKISQAAKILNDSVLFFTRDYRKTNSELMKMVSVIEMELSRLNSEKIPKNLKVTTKKALLIQQPKLGFTIHVDLIEFRNDYLENTAQIANSWLGNYYFELDNTANPAKQKRYDGNREKVYYNSKLHFLRALFELDLGKNGYQLMIKKEDPIKEELIYETFDISPYLQNKEKNQLVIQGLNGQTLEIFYYKGKKGYPRNVKRRAKGSTKHSTIQFNADQCVVRSNGTTPDSNIQFGGVIANKKVGSLLPEDYRPPSRN